jgi:hypothetical protein
MNDNDSFADLTSSAKKLVGLCSLNLSSSSRRVQPNPPLEYVWTGTARPLQVSSLGPHGPALPSHDPALPTARSSSSHRDGLARPMFSLPAWPTRALPGLISTCGSYFPARRRTHPQAQPPGPGLDPTASHTRPLRPHHMHLASCAVAKMPQHFGSKFGS